jgi:hypothetical protein
VAVVFEDREYFVEISPSELAFHDDIHVASHAAHLANDEIESYSQSCKGKPVMVRSVQPSGQDETGYAKQNAKGHVVLPRPCGARLIRL